MLYGHIRKLSWRLFSKTVVQFTGAFTVPQLEDQPKEATGNRMKNDQVFYILYGPSRFSWTSGMNAMFLSHIHDQVHGQHHSPWFHHSSNSSKSKLDTLSRTVMPLTGKFTSHNLQPSLPKLNLTRVLTNVEITHIYGPKCQSSRFSLHF